MLAPQPSAARSTTKTAHASHRLLAAIASAMLIAFAATPSFAACGDGTVDRLEQCDDGNQESGDCCSATCALEANGSSCTPEDPCLGAGNCSDGTCRGGAPVTCNDDNPCTTDSCLAGYGCVATAIDGCCMEDSECSDDIDCNGAETCNVSPFTGTGTCASGTPVACNDGDPCTYDSCSIAKRGCVATLSVTAPGCTFSDDDSDGVWDRLDECTDTPAGTPVDSDGCAAGDRTERPSTLIGESDAAYEKLVTGILSPPDYARERRYVARIRKGLEKAAYAYASGRSCTASKLFFKAQVSNERILLSLNDRRANAYTNALRSPIPATGGTISDQTEGDFRSNYERVAIAMVQDAAAPFLLSSIPVDTTCLNASRATLQGTVAEVARDGRRMKLGDGTVVRTGNAVVSGALLPGAPVKITGERIGLGEFVGGVVVSSTHPKLELAPYDIRQCFNLKIVPIQDRSSYTDPETTPLGGYRFEGAPLTDSLYLETGMGILLEPKACSAPGTTPDASGNYTLYYADISIDTKLPLSSVTAHASFTDVRAEDERELPKDVRGQGTMRIRWMSRPCNTSQGSSCFVSNANPPMLMREDNYNVAIGKRGSYCQTEYDNTVFSLPDSHPGAGFEDFLPAQVVATGGLAAAMGGTREFTAKAYRVLNSGVASYPFFQDVADNEPFGIYPTYDPYYDVAGDPGVDVPAGLAWPRVRGTRNGADYSYACTVPNIVRDLVDDCADEPDSYYRLPWGKSEGQVTCGQGNNSTFTHCGDGYPVTCTQKYAFDFGVPDGHKVKAARGGVVIDAYDSAAESCSDKTKCTKEQFYCCLASAGGGTCIKGSEALLGTSCHAGSDCGTGGTCAGVANTVSILHSDGTVGVYAHMREGSVPVERGDVVYRGDSLGLIGNTGCSTGPHLHFHVIGMASDGSGWQKATIPVRFETSAGSCITPGSNTKHTSTN